jgi:hypothetical protein
VLRSLERGRIYYNTQTQVSGAPGVIPLWLDLPALVRLRQVDSMQSQHAQMSITIDQVPLCDEAGIVPLIPSVRLGIGPDPVEGG